MAISRRQFIQNVALGGAGLSLADTVAANSSQKGETKKALNTKNIVIITADQLAKRAVGAYGNSDVKTPNIDNLIHTGVSFDNGYCSYPLCAPSRSCFWTGCLPHQTGVVANDNPNIPETLATVGTLFSAVGYECRHFGKRHDHGALKGFDSADQVELDFPAEKAFPVNYDTREDVYCLQESLKYINGLNQRKEKKPFILAVEFNNPHNINGWIGKFAGEHGDIDGIGELPDVLDNFDTAADLINRPKAVQYACCTHTRVKQAGKWNVKNYQQYLKAYYYYTELADNYIGQIIDALKSNGLYEDTLIVFFADHGDAMGAHRLVTKMNWFYEEATNVPLVFRGPGIQTGQLKSELVSLCDLLPTLCDYVGIDIPQGIYGRSLLPLLTGQHVDQWRDYVIAHWNTNRNLDLQPARMLRTQEYKYVLYKEDEEEELYDMQRDRGETQNLAHLAEYQDTKKALRGMLDKHIQNVADPFYSQDVLLDYKQWRSHPVGYEHHVGDTSTEIYLREIRPLLKQKAFDDAHKIKLALQKKIRFSFACEMPTK
ncbi:sulfatase-like hydrolase/transferase [Pasteurellaceae bacterium HPA106]|uniref:sulfatase family protein n=1 Tax=Spirabiliibacterium pneumoniae TaxID=221400 RepID=UPI001AAC8354|nr:sulfatase-like hydrolase/transferase [Spirabiliibacterium pneumoniae]MBE2895277.1 sulfatase-like hydrolase/transferase [Spirabiliibacterium pneumoniae]